MRLLVVVAVAALGGSARAAEPQGRQQKILVCGKQAAIIAFSAKHPEGIVEWSYPVNTREGWVLPDGGMLAALTNGNRVVEFDADGKIRWQVTAAEVDGAINDACGVQRLPNGNTMIASYRIGNGGERMLEVTPDKQVVWAWKADLPGVGHASPVVWREHVYTAAADEAAGLRYLLCHDLATGKRLWSRAISGPIDRHHNQNSSASGSVAADPHGIYWLWGTRENIRLEAVSHDGQPRWHVDLGPFAAEHGFGGTPTVCGDLVVVPLEQDGPGVVIGIDAVTGKERWRLPRDGVDKAAYSTPLVITTADGAAVICTSHGHGLYAVDPGTGRVLWENRCFPRRTVSSPIQAAGLLIGTSGDGGGNNLLVAVRPPDASSAEATVAYSIDKSAAPYVPTPLESHGRLYLWGDRGVVTCVRAADGLPVWKGRVGGNYSASPISLGSRIINVSSDGEIVVIAEGDSFEVLGRTPLDEETRATPAAAGGWLLFRSASRLWALPIGERAARSGADGD